MENTPTSANPATSVTSERDNEQPAGKAATQDSAVVAAADGSTVFDSLTKLPADLVPTGMQVNKFSGHYVHLNTTPKYFDWDGFANAVVNYPNDDLIGVPIDYTRKNGILLKHRVVPGSDLDVVEVSSKESPGEDEALMPRGVEEQALENVFNWMVYILHDVLGIAIDKGELYATVHNTFTNLQWAESSGFASFSTTSVGTNSSWEYRTVYGYPRPGEGNRFFALPTTIYLEANIQSESSWWGIVTTTVARFDARIRAGKLLVTKGFVSPV